MNLRNRLPFLLYASKYQDLIVEGTDKLDLQDALKDWLYYVNAYGKSVQSNVPYDYRELEYIESTGTQYIDTGIILDKVASELFITFKKTDSADIVSLMGCQDSSIAGYNLRQTYYYTNARLQFYNSTAADYSILGNADNVKHTIHTIVDNNNNITINIDGVTRTFTQQSSMSDNTLNLYLFANNSNGSAIQKIPAQIYHVWVKNSFGVLVFNGIPCKNASGVVGMYDTVSGQFFGNAGTGEFIAGPEVVTSLPSPCVRIDYVDMQAGSYVLTNIIPTYDCEIEMDFQTTTLPAVGGSFFGGRTAAYPAGLTFGFNVNKTFVFDGFSTNRYTSTTTLTNNTRYKYTWNNKVATLYQNNTVIESNTFTGEDANGAASAINALNNNGSIIGNTAGIYLYSFKVRDNTGKLIADYVPARIDARAVLYDRVTNQTIMQDTGTWEPGPDTTITYIPTPDNPIDIWCNNGVIKYSANLCDVIPDNIMVGKYISGQGVLVDSDFNFTYIKYIPVKPNTKYTLSLSGAVYFMSISEYSSADDTGFVVRRTKYSTSSTPPFNLTYFTLTTGATTNYIRWDANIFRTQAITLNDVLAINWMFNKGDSMPYQPYVEGGIYADGTVETLQLTGKNLFDYSIGLQLSSDPTVVWTMEHGGVTFSLNQATGLYTVSGTATGSGGRNTLRTQTFYLPAGIYTMQTTNNPEIQVLLVNETTGNTIADNSSVSTQITQTFTLTETTPLHFGLSRTVGTTYNDSFYLQIEQGSTATDYQPYTGDTATCEDLLSIGDYTDEQEIISGVVTRNVGIKVLDGTENWQNGSGIYATNCYCDNLLTNLKRPAEGDSPAVCTVFPMVEKISDFSVGKGYVSSNPARRVNLWYNDTVANFKQYLAQQYAAGTPVIIVYPLATETTSIVSEQPLQLENGNNVLQIIEASLNDLKLEAKYRKRK